ncbi:MAG: hypothetical protein JWR42_474 [Marmoricola sp.]|nr:hypothetical protein [Marmoricola sp.]
MAALTSLLLASGCAGGATDVQASRTAPPVPAAQAASPSSSAPPGPSRANRSSHALTVLHAWDARRLAAWRRADPGALARLYVPGSRTGRADVRLLREYADHGLVVRRLVTQVFAVQVVGRSPSRGRGRLVLRVTDRVASGTATRDGSPVALATTAPVVRVVTLERQPAGTPSWRVREATRLRG